MSRIEQALEKATRLRQNHPLGEEVGTPRLPLVNAVPSLSPLPSAERTPDNPLLVTLSAPGSPIAEEYRKLKSMVMKLTKQDGFHNTLMVASALAGEGKSLTSLNLALSLAQEFDHSVLLVDADLRKPSIHRYLGLNPTLGLTDCLARGIDLSEAIIPTGLGKLSYLPAGSEVPNPVELFSSQTMRNVIAEIKNRYRDRYVIIDTPPLLPFAETRLLGHLVDNVLLVVKERQATLHQLQEAISVLQGAQIIGMVFNNVTVDLLSEQYHYYRGYYQQS
jgi:protein-tyrosine kinase